MSAVALILNVSLGLLLLCALMLGMRLDRRLRALRESHASFAKAVSELDQAAVRTESGLADLKQTAEMARSSLAERIDAAQVLAERLETLTTVAKTTGEDLARRALEARPLPLRQVVDGPPAQATAAAPAPGLSKAIVDDDLFESRRPSLSALKGGRR